MNFLVFLNKMSTIGQWMSSKLPLVSLEVTIFALVVWIILKLVRFHSAKVREAFWLTVLFKMVFSLFIAWPISWSFILGQSINSEHILASSALSAKQAIQQPQSVSALSLTGASEPSQAVLGTDEVAWWRQLNWQQVIAIVWLLGCGLMLGRLALGLRMLGKLRKNTYSAPEFMQRILCSCKKQLNIGSDVKLKLSDDMEAPILCGFLRPIIILPGRYVEWFSQQELRLMLIHELAHWKYRDTWVLFAKRLIEVTFFFHPVVWYAGKQAVKEAEVACDDLVVTLSEESTTYANCLMQILQQSAGRKQHAVGGLAVGGTVTAHRIRKLLKEGSRMISPKIKPQIIITSVLVALLGLPSWFVVKGDSAETASSASTAIRNKVNLYDMAIEKYQKMIETNPKDVKARENLAKLYEEKGDDSSAVAEYKKIIQIQPDNAQWYKTLGDLYRKPRVVNSIRDNALSLDGDGDYVEIADSEMLNNLSSQVTMESWIRPTRFSNDWMPIFFKGDKRTINLNRSYTLWLHRVGFLYLGSSLGNTVEISLRSTRLIKLNNWYHVAGVVDTKNRTMRIFINGHEVAGRDFGNKIKMSHLPLRIGWTHEEYFTHAPFAGQIDEVRIWSVARTQQEIQDNMNSKLTGDEPFLVGYWEFNRSEGTRKVIDSSPNKNDGKLVGDAKIIGYDRPVFAQPTSDKLAKAAEAYSKAIELVPDSYELYRLLAQTYIQMNKLSDAEQVYRQALDRISYEEYLRLLRQKLTEVHNLQKKVK